MQLPPHLVQIGYWLQFVFAGYLHGDDAFLHGKDSRIARILRETMEKKGDK
ncbi:MAG: hypothetical protein ACR2P4_02920 [Gammaproteobacteria bacterium]